jgi:uncharacterized protein (TIGR03437 family)
VIRALSLIVLAAVVAAGQVVETRVFRALLSPANEVPPVSGLSAAGMATIRVHVMKTTSGQILSASVDFVADYRFDRPAVVTGLHIHGGRAGQNGPVTVNSGITSNVPVEISGPGTIERQAQVLATDRNGLDTLTGMFADASGYYVNLHTSDNPDGAIRGQLLRAETVIVIGMMAAGEEVPPVALNASAVGTVIATVTRDGAGVINSGEVVFDVEYNFPSRVTFTGLHVHAGQAGVNGPVILNSGMTRLDSADSGRGNLRFRAEMTVSNAAVVDALEALLANPRSHYINLHTTEFTGGAVRAQLRSTDSMTFTVRPSPANEVPPVTGLDASAIADVRLHSLRGEEGAMRAGLVVFDLNYRFPGEVEIRGMHVHDGVSGENGPVRLDSGLSAATPVRSQSGFGNAFLVKTISEPERLATMNSMVSNPERHYFNLHTTTHVDGALRAPMGLARSAAPTIGGAVSAVGDEALRNAAPGGLISIFGTNLARMPVDLNGWAGGRLPFSLNGVEVTIGGRRAPLLYVGETQINAQVPFESATGEQEVIARQGGVSSAASTLNVTATAPGLFSIPGRGGAIVKTDFSLVAAGNAAAPGEVVIAFGTGFGQTMPVLETGALTPADRLRSVGPVRVAAGGRDAEVLGAAASPGFAGLYQVAFRVPAALSAGSVPVLVQMGTAQSNTVSLAVR